MEADMRSQTKGEEKRMDRRCNLRGGIDRFGYQYVVTPYPKVIWSSFNIMLEYLLCYTQLQYHSCQRASIISQHAS